MPQTVGPLSWLSETSAAKAEQSVKPIIDAASWTKDQVLEALQQPTIPSFASGIPSLSALMGQPEAPSQTGQTASQQPASFASAIPSLESLLPKPKPQPVTQPASGAPSSMPQQPAAGAGQTGSGPQMLAGTGVAPERAGEYRAYARQVAAQYGIDPDIFDRQLTQESGYNPAARSPVGAAGIGQFMPGTAAQYGVDVNDPYSSIDGAARHMRDLLKANGGNYRLALAAYNAGQGNVDKWGEGVFDDDFAEGQTRDYVNIILGPGSARPAQRQSSMNAAGPTAATSPQPAAGASSTPAAGLPPSVAQAWQQRTGGAAMTDEDLQQLRMLGVVA